MEIFKHVGGWAMEKGRDMLYDDAFERFHVFGFC